MSETVLVGGDVNVVVRRPMGPWSQAVHTLLRHFEAVGFDGAPRFLGDWDLARRGKRADDADSKSWGLPLDRLGHRLRLLCDGYQLGKRSDLVDRLITLRHSTLGADPNRDRRARRHIRWLEQHRAEHEAWL